jgi:hypothetical protein
VTFYEWQAGYTSRLAKDNGSLGPVPAELTQADLDKESSQWTKGCLAN